MIKDIYIWLKGLHNTLYNEVSGLSLYQRLFCLRLFGKNNKVLIERGARIGNKVKITIYGTGHCLLVKEGGVIKSGSMWFEDKNGLIEIDKDTTIEDAALAVAEEDTYIRIGKDCMLSSHIHITTTDSHSVVDSEGVRINPASSIVIGNHVWIGRNVTINKGVKIGDNSIIAGNSVVTKDVISKCIAAGVPARIVKENVNWLRQRT